MNATQSFANRGAVTGNADRSNQPNSPSRIGSPPTTAGETARLLMRNFPGWLCWYGDATRTWWTAPPLGCWYPSLIEALTPAELAARIHEICAAARRVA
jgi:hypothetical protein